jgi:hypothetical protein
MMGVSRPTLKSTPARRVIPDYGRARRGHGRAGGDAGRGAAFPSGEPGSEGPLGGNRGLLDRVVLCMDRDRPDAAARHAAELAALQGEVCALRGMVAVLVAHLALLGRDPHARREEILRSLESMLPGALAQIEQNAPPAASAGFERAVETVTHLARTAVRFEPMTPPRQGVAAHRTPRRQHDPGA